ncbi:HET-domain-containing protein, partial [Cucurbitaria berberidis CBS 394.84]
MRLLNTRTLELTIFIGNVPEYVILSHRWEEDELTFEHIVKDPISNPKSRARQKQNFKKIQGTCALAARDGFDWVWIDSCCINKSSSAELQEAINSMFRWYQEAEICYAFLNDVPNQEAGWGERFRHSKWFTRGWTLQELLAPATVEFYAADWSPIGTKISRYEEVSYITRIAPIALSHQWHTVWYKFLAAEKMSWAAHRKVSRAEDETYCLLGLFDVNLPLLYGEGSEKAFRRLQGEIYKMDGDCSLFLF